MKARRSPAKINTTDSLARRNREMFREIMNNLTKAPTQSMSDEERVAHKLLLGALRKSPGLVLLLYSPRIRGDLTLNLAKIVAKDLKGNKDLIRDGARREHKRFFILLGKCLSGEIKPALFDKTDYAIVDILNHNPAISAKDAVRELKKRRHTINEEMFRMRKHRLIHNKAAAFEELLATSREYLKA